MLGRQVSRCGHGKRHNVRERFEVKQRLHTCFLFLFGGAPGLRARAAHNQDMRQIFQINKTRALKKQRSDSVRCVHRRTSARRITVRQEEHKLCTGVRLLKARTSQVCRQHHTLRPMIRRVANIGRAQACSPRRGASPVQSGMPWEQSNVRMGARVAALSPILAVSAKLCKRQCRPHICSRKPHK